METKESVGLKLRESLYILVVIEYIFPLYPELIISAYFLFWPAQKIDKQNNRNMLKFFLMVMVLYIEDFIQ